jgi:Secretion system C-terminal sorting domain
MNKILLSFSLSLLCLNLFSQGNPVPYTYNYTLTATSPTFNRPLANADLPPIGLSGTGTAVRYNIYRFTPSITGSYTFTNLSSFDSFGLLYLSPFNPASPLANVLIADDDDGVPPAADDFLFTITLTAAVSYTLVNTAFSNTALGTGATTITGPAGAVLPLKWLQVGGLITTQKKGVISWSAEESQVALYQIERSNNGIDFTAVGRIASKGDGVNQYSFTDAITISNAAWYRILQEDVNGKITYSRIIQLKVSSKGVTIYPNPAREQIQVSVGQNLLNTNMQLLNLAGQVLQIIKVQQSNFSINLNEYKTGIYLLQFEDGSSYKVVVK